MKYATASTANARQRSTGAFDSVVISASCGCRLVCGRFSSPCLEIEIRRDAAIHRSARPDSRPAPRPTGADLHERGLDPLAVRPLIGWHRDPLLVKHRSSANDAGAGGSRTGGVLEHHVEVSGLDDPEVGEARLVSNVGGSWPYGWNPVGRLVRHLCHVLQPVAYCGRPAGR